MNRTDRENQTIVLALLRSQQAFMRAMGPVFKANDLTASQWDVLETLSNKGELSVNELMKLTLGTSGNVDVVIRNLIRADWIEKSVNEDDRRARVLRLTSAGRAKIESFMPAHNRALGRLLGGLSSETKRSTIEALNHLRKQLMSTQGHPA